MDEFQRQIKSHITVAQSLLQGDISESMEAIVNLCVQALESGNKILLCGNGGSAADAEHIAGELSGRFYLDRKPLPAIALTLSSAHLTAVSNDYGYDQAFARSVEALATAEDILISYSTSGSSSNVVNAMKQARTMGLHTVGFTGSDPRDMASLCDHLVCIASQDTPRIQEMHMLLGHYMAEQIERRLFGTDAS